MTHVESAPLDASAFRAMHERVLSFACRLADAHTAEDLVQEAFARALAYARPGGGTLNAAYLKAIVRNLANDLHSRRTRDERAAAARGAERPATCASGADRIDPAPAWLRHELERLTPRQWSSVMLTIARGLPEEIVACADGITRTAVAGSRERALRALRESVRRKERAA